MGILLENILISKDYTLSKCIILQNAAVVELVDTSDSKSDSRKGVTVQVRSAVPNYSTSNIPVNDNSFIAFSASDLG